MATNNKDFRIKNGLVVEGSTATVNGNAIITSASSVNDLADVTVSSPSTGQVLKWNGSAWVNDTDATGAGGSGNSFTTIDVPNGTDPVADSSTDTLTFADGANITITGNSTTDTITVAVDSDIININSITFDTTPTSPGTDPGTIYWDDGDGVPKAILNANVTVGINQELILKVKNSTGSTIAKGKVVYINGAQGQNPTIALADADTEATSSKTFGFVAEQILDTEEGFVVTEGVLRGVNTDGLTEGGALYLSSTAGGYTQTAPAEPAHLVFLGYVVKAHLTAGEIIVKIQNGYELTELHGVTIDGTPADNEVLAYDNSSSLWINQTAAEAGLAVTGHTHSLTDVTDVTASAAELNILDGATLSTTELNYVDGVTSAIQTQINGKANTSHTHSLADVTDVTASAAELNILDGATLSTTELNYVDGVTSAIQTQIDGKASTSHTHGNITNDGKVGSTSGLVLGTTTAGAVAAFTASAPSSPSTEFLRGDGTWVVPTDTNTTYTVSAETATGGANLRLTDSSATTDDVKIASGTNVTVTRTDANTITISSTDTDTNTTYSVSAETVAGGANLRLTGSDTTTDDVKIASGTNVTVSRTDANTITIDATDTNTVTRLQGTGGSYVSGDVIIQGTGATSTSQSGNTITIAVADGTTSVKGAVQLSDTVGSTSDTVAATPGLVYDSTRVTLRQTITSTGTQSVDLTGAPPVVFAVVVGAGGGGGNGNNISYQVGGGGGGGAVVSGWVPAQSSCFVGTGGTGSSVSGGVQQTGTAGGSSYYSGLFAQGGSLGGSAAAATQSTNGAGTGGSGNTTTAGTITGTAGSTLAYAVGGAGGSATTGGGTVAPAAPAAAVSGGGGGGALSSSTTLNATGGTGGAGQAGGGGGGAAVSGATTTGVATGGTGGAGVFAGGTATATTATGTTGKNSGGGGGGGYLAVGSNSSSQGTGTTGRNGANGGSGGGGGGGGTGNGSGGNGGNGCVLIYW